MRCVQLTVCGMLAALLLASAAHGSSLPRTLGSVTEQTPIAAHDGWVVWSVPAPGGGFGLRAWRHGSAGTLTVLNRSEPFDVDLGTDARGRTVATFSRCTAATMRLTPATTVAAGCRIRVVDLATATERLVRMPHPAGTTDTVPSMWRGRVAFARRDSGRHRYIPQILLWSPVSKRLTVLHHGAVPARCPTFRTVRCARGRVVASAGAIDLGSDLVALEWNTSASDNAFWDYPETFREIRAEQLARRRSSVLASVAFDREVCAGDPDNVLPTAPTVDGSVVSYAQLTERCFTYRSQLVRSRVRPGAPTHGPLAGNVGRAAVDGGSLYAFVFPENPRGEAPACNRPRQPCLIRQLAMPRLSAIRTGQSTRSSRGTP